MRTAGTLALLFIVLGMALTGCKTRSREEIMTDPALVYERAHRALLQGDYPLAIKIYEALMARSPFAAGQCATRYAETPLDSRLPLVVLPDVVLPRAGGQPYADSDRQPLSR